MRSIFALIAILSLVSRWGDAPCGCAAHHGWVKSPECHHAHDPGKPDEPGVPDEQDEPAGPVVTHGCEEECGVAVYPISLRVVLPAAASAAPEGFDARQKVGLWCEGEAGSPGGPPSRAMLGVYRI